MWAKDRARRELDHTLKVIDLRRIAQLVGPQVEGFAGGVIDLNPLVLRDRSIADLTHQQVIGRLRVAVALGGQR